MSLGLLTAADLSLPCYYVVCTLDYRIFVSQQICRLCFCTRFPRLLKALTLQRQMFQIAAVRRVPQYTGLTHYFYRATYPSAVYTVIVCLSVCPSVTSRSSTKTAKRMITETTPYDSPGTNFRMPKVPATFQRDHPLKIGPSVNSAFHFITWLCRRTPANGTQPNFVKRWAVSRDNNLP